MIIVIILIGFVCLIIAGWTAIRFAPSWQLSSNMDSRLDPDSDYLTNRPQAYIEPVSQSILTPPLWMNIFQTPGASVPQRTPLPTRTTVPVMTSPVVPVTTIPAVPTLSPTNTLIYIPASPTHTQRPPAQDTDTPTATPTPVSIEADLAITKDNGIAMYSAGSVLTYQIIVSNSGPAPVTGAIVRDNLPTQFSDWSWICTAQNAGASGCDAVARSPVNFSDTVDLPSGASIQYTVTVQVLKTASGELVNTAEVITPAANIERDPSNNIASDTDQFLATSTLPVGNIGETRDDVTAVLTSGSYTTLMFSTPLVVSGHAGYDLVYYEKLNGTGIAMDLVALELGDGNNWYPIFYWGDDMPDTNSNMDISVIGGPETDNRDFTSSPAADVLYNGTGIAIELDTVVPPGTYPYIRVISPPTAAYSNGVDLDGGGEIDAIAILN